MRATPWLLCMGLFSIFWLGAGSVACRAVARGQRPPSPVGFGAAAFARFASEGWWARQDSNLRPDRYERGVLTIELQAPPRACRTQAARNGAGTPYSDGRRSGNAAFPAGNFRLPTRVGWPD